MTDADKKAMLTLVAQALHEIGQATLELYSTTTTPPVRPPRPRRFELGGGLYWPRREGREPSWHTLGGPQGVRIQTGYELGEAQTEAAEALCEHLRWRPRAILRAVRRMQAATAWCRKRKEGMQREAANILRQQAGAVRLMSAEVAAQQVEQI